MKHIRLSSLYVVLLLLFVACQQASVTPSTPSTPSGTSAEIVTITSTSSTSALITFNQEMAENASNKDNYEITHETSSGQILKLSVVEAVLSENAKQVTLTTLTQTQVSYSVKISNVTSKDEKILDTSKNNTFVGTAGTGAGADSDGDGLTDVQEQQGWTVTVKNGDENVSESRVTSDPAVADTDEDGVNDGEEFAKSIDPRASDTDADGISDFDEINLFASLANNKDTDKDGLADKVEADKGSSLTDKDSDGDGKVDADDPSPAIADMPALAIEFVGEPSISLDITFENGKEFSFEKSTSIGSDTSSELTRSDSVANQSSVENTKSITTSAEVSSGIPPGGSVSVSGTLSQTKSFSQEKVLTVDRTSAKSIQKQSNELEGRSENSAISTSSGSITQGIKLVNTGDLAFRVNDLTLSVLYRDPKTPEAFQSIATLEAQQDISNVVLGTSESSETGVITFATESIGNVPLLRQFLANPNALIFSVATRSILNRESEDFSFIEEDIDNKTAFIVVDFGNGTVVRERIATTRYASGKVALPEALQMLGLSFTSSTRQGSTDTAAFPNGVKVLDSVTTEGVTVRTDASTRSFWYLLTPNTKLSDPKTNFDDLNLEAGDIIYLVYDQDKDGDKVMARDEFLSGSSDEKIDSDDDGLTDFEELKVGWEVNLAGETVRVFSDPSNADADGDGVNDWEESKGCLDANRDQLCDSDLRQPATDPSKADTDFNGESDGDALSRFARLELVKQFGTESDNRGIALATDSNDFMYLAWISFLPRVSSDIYINKYDAEGTEIYSKQVVLASEDLFLRDMDVDSAGNIYVLSQTGFFDGGTIIKFNTDGVEQWRKAFVYDGTESFNFVVPKAIAADDAGSVYITGQQGFYTNGNPSDEDILVKKFRTSDGAELWSKVISTLQDDTPYGIATGDGKIFITGETKGSLDGFSNTDNNGTSDAFILTLDSDGNSLRAQHVLGQSDSVRTNEVGRDVAYHIGHSSCPGVNEEVHMVGHTDDIPFGSGNGGSEPLTYPSNAISFDYGTSEDDELVAMTPSSSCSSPFHRAGNTKGGISYGNGKKHPNAGGYDIFMDFLQFGSEEDDIVTDITTTSQGIFMTGYTKGSLFSNPNAGLEDVFLIKISR